MNGLASSTNLKSVIDVGVARYRVPTGVVMMSIRVKTMTATEGVEPVQFEFVGKFSIDVALFGALEISQSERKSTSVIW